MMNLKYRLIRIFLVLLHSGILFENFHTSQVQSPDNAKQNGFVALNFDWRISLVPCAGCKRRLRHAQSQGPEQFFYQDRNERRSFYESWQSGLASVTAIRIGIVKQYGLDAEWHNVTTDDGYILSLFRIPPTFSLSNKTNGNRVIFLQHGIVGTADSFVMMNSTRSPAYFLSAAGYDVWLGNLRGNTYSRRHEALSTDDPEFWDFSLDEYALSDLPTMIDYVINTTKQPRITYMGHSLGTSIIMMLLSEQQEYNDKLDCSVLLAPIAYWNPNTSSAAYGLLPIRLIAQLSPTGNFELLPQNNLLPFLCNYICPINKFTMEICVLPMDLLFGKDREQVSPDLMMKFLTYYPGGASAKVFYHYMQHFDNGEFSHYDYKDDELNLQRYGRINPPSYNLKNIQTPIIAVHSLNDPLSEDEQVEYLLKQFSNDTNVIYDVVNDKNFNHIDFLIGKDAKEILYDPLIQTMLQFHDDE